jgi:hypothetical protein
MCTYSTHIQECIIRKKGTNRQTGMRASVTEGKTVHGRDRDRKGKDRKIHLGKTKS